MGGLANFAGALGGAVVQTTNRWIDEEMQRNKAQALADLEVQTRRRIREDDDAFKNDPSRVARDRENRRQDKLSDAKAGDEAALQSLTNTTLMDAKESAADRAATAETGRRKRSLMELGPVEAQNEGAKTAARESAQTAAMRERLPLEVQRAAATADAAARASAKYRDKPPGAAERLADIEAVLGRKLAEPEKLALLGLAKGEKGATVEEEDVYDHENKLVSRKVTTKGPAGAKRNDEDPILAALEQNRKKREAGKTPAAATVAAKPAGQSLEQIVGVDEAQTLRALANSLQQMKSGLATAARSGGDVPGNTEAVTRASQAISQRLANMSDQQRALVERLLGF